MRSKSHYSWKETVQSSDAFETFWKVANLRVLVLLWKLLSSLESVVRVCCLSSQSDGINTMNKRCSQKCARPGMSTYYIHKISYIVAFGSGSRVTHSIMQMTNSNVQASSGLVSFCIMNQHSLQAILESDQPVLAVVLLRFLYRFGIDPVSDGVRRNLGMPMLSIVRDADVEERWREHRETFGYGADTRDGGDGRKDRARFRQSERRWHNCSEPKSGDCHDDGVSQ